MDIEIIRLFGASYIMESDLAVKEKDKLVDYVREAEWDQILNLVFNGSPPNRKLTVNEQYILEAQAESHIYPLILRYIVTEGPKEDAEKIYTKTKDKVVDYSKKGQAAYKKHSGSVIKGSKRIGILVVIAAATAAGHRVYKMYLTKAGKSCKGLRGSQKRDCVVKFKKAAYQAKLNSYMKAKSDCRKTRNPERCQRALDTKVKKMKYKIATLYSRH